MHDDSFRRGNAASQRVERMPLAGRRDDGVLAARASRIIFSPIPVKRSKAYPPMSTGHGVQVDKKKLERLAGRTH